MTRRRSDYAVGYGKPPKHSQFKKGHSGNPKGQRKRAPKSIKTILNEVLDRKIRVVEAGASRRVTIREVIITRLAAKAANGDIAALSLLLTFKADARSRAELPPYEIRIIPDRKAGSG
ncbi:MAG TPA: DUF5681 domain-containing protein [Stellaceae bacterium]|nr:DUF5681 domain-containing protein [Stellaceae bacterium]